MNQKKKLKILRYMFLFYIKSAKQKKINHKV